MIYCAQGLNGGSVKIGFTDNLPQRMKELEAHYKQPLAVLATMEGGRAEEAEIHSRFAHLRFGRTEQFRPAADLMAFIGRPLLVSPNPDAVEAMAGHSNPTIIQLHGSHAFKEWAEALSRHDRIPLSFIAERALRMYAKAVGFLGEAPER